MYSLKLDLDKCDGPNIIPTKILKLLNEDISDQLAILFNHVHTKSGNEQ